MKNLILLTCLFSLLISNSQTDFTKHAELLISAQRASEKNDSKKALSFYEYAFKINENNKLADYLSASLCAAKSKNESAFKTIIIKAIENEKVSEESLKSYSQNPNYQKYINALLPNYDKHLEVFYESIENPIIYHQVEELVMRDQLVRKLNTYYLGVNEKQQEEAFDAYLKAQAEKDTIALKKYKAILFPEVNEAHDAYNTKIIKYTDSLNVRELIEITKNHGWQKNAWLLLWHQRGSYGEDNWIWNYFKPVINKEISQGRIAPFFWAMFEDLKALMANGESIYGYHPGKVNSDMVNTNRVRIGLPELTKQEIINRNTRRDKGRIF